MDKAIVPRKLRLDWISVHIFHVSLSVFTVTEAKYFFLTLRAPSGVNDGFIR